MFMLNLTSRLSTTVIGLLIYFVPFFSYLTPSNLNQLSGYNVLEIFVTLLTLLLLIFISSFSIETIIKRFFKKNIILFPFVCFAFYLNFLYIPFFDLIQEFLFLKYSYRGGIGITIFIILEFFCFGIIVFGAKYNDFSLRMILIFSILMLISACIPLASYLLERTSNKTINSYEFNSDLIVQDKIQIKRNIYYIILDAMASLESLEPLNIASKNAIIDKLSNVELRYIDKSHSSYSETKFSVTSMMLLDYHKNPNSPRFTDSSSYYPKMMYDMKNEIPLLSYLKKVNSSFYWAAGENFNCVPTARWICVNTHRKFLKSAFFIPSLNVWNFFLTTPFPKFTIRFFKNTKSQDTIGPFIEYIDKNGIPKMPFFAYIHHNIPHQPYLSTSECDTTNYYNQRLEGYKASYQCAIKTIQVFMQKINKIDPEAIVIFQGDHGLREFFNLNLSEHEKNLFTGSIFNAIKAPQSCFEKYDLPKTTVNSIRFALNCAYNFKLPYRKNIHYYSENLGKVVERKLYE